MRKGLITEVYDRWNGKDNCRVGIVDWCNADGILDMLEDIEPTIIDLESFPELNLHDVVEMEVTGHKSLRLISVNGKKVEDVQ